MHPAEVHLTYSLTLWSSVLLEQLTGSQLSGNFLHFMEIRKFITAYKTARHLSLSWARSIHSKSPHPTSWRSTLILSSHLCLGIPSGLFPSVFPTKTPYAPPLLSKNVLHVPPISFFLILSPEKYLVRSTHRVEVCRSSLHARLFSLKHYSTSTT